MAPSDVVLEFLDLLEQREVDAAVDLLDPDVVYTNVSLPTIRGRERVRRAFRASLGREKAAFEVTVHAHGTDGDVVLTERTDVLIYGPVRVEFWVYGRFEVRDGLIAVWRDSFDWLNIASATIKGLVRAVVRRR